MMAAVRPRRQKLWYYGHIVPVSSRQRRHQSRRVPRPDAQNGRGASIGSGRITSDASRSFRL